MIAVLALLLSPAWAEDDGTPPETRYVEVSPRLRTAGGFTFLALVQARVTTSNLDSTNPFLDGQVVGRLGGTTGIVPSPDVFAVYSEQRLDGFLGWRPKILGGKGGVMAAFEVDFAFGDRSYSTGGNTGGAFGGDQVNLQTRRLYAEWLPSVGHNDFHVVLGLQFVADSASDPTEGGPDDLLRHGGRLMFFGSEAAGVSVYGRLHDLGGTHLRYRLGAYTLYEQAMSHPDDAWIAMGDVEMTPAYATTIGAHAWYLQDRSGGAVGGLGIGPTSALSEMLGGPKVDLYDGQTPPPESPIDADLVWLGLDGGYNASLQAGPVGVSGVAMMSLGRLYAPIVHDDRVVGALVDVEARGRFAPGEGSVAKVEGLWSTGDGADPQTYGGIVTGNSYGVAGAVHATHGTMLLFPDPRSINRMVSVVSDVSGAGQGVLGVTGSVGYDPIPDRLNLTVGGGTAFTAAGVPWGTELNGKVVVEPLVMCDVGLYVAGLVPGAASGLLASPWTAYVAVDWLLF